MICPNCNIAMKTEDGSEKGFADGKDYFTEEIKFCSKCGRRITEKYEARLIEELPDIKL